MSFLNEDTFYKFVKVKVNGRFQVNGRFTQTYRLKKLFGVLKFLQNVTLFIHKHNNLRFLSSNDFFALINHTNYISKPRHMSNIL